MRLPDYIDGLLDAYDRGSLLLCDYNDDDLVDVDCLYAYLSSCNGSSDHTPEVYKRIVRIRIMLVVLNFKPLSFVDEHYKRARLLRASVLQLMKQSSTRSYPMVKKVDVDFQQPFRIIIRVADEEATRSPACNEIRKIIHAASLTPVFEVVSDETDGPNSDFLG